MLDALFDLFDRDRRSSREASGRRGLGSLLSRLSGDEDRHEHSDRDGSRGRAARRHTDADDRWSDDEHDRPRSRRDDDRFDFDL